jgi:hypothetical protein
MAATKYFSSRRHVNLGTIKTYNAPTQRDFLPHLWWLGAALEVASPSKLSTVCISLAHQKCDLKHFQTCSDALTLVSGSEWGLKNSLRELAAKFIESLKSSVGIC